MTTTTDGARKSAKASQTDAVELLMQDRYSVDQYSHFDGAAFDTVDLDLARDWEDATNDSSPT